MTLPDPSSIEFSKSESETEPEAQENYPDEVLESEWSPVLREIHSLLPNKPEPRKTTPVIVDTAKLRRFQ